MKYALITSVVLLALSVASANASYIVLGTHADHPIEPGLSLEDVRLAVEMQVDEHHALITFTNVSVGDEEAVIKEIVIDSADDDTGDRILWDPQVLTCNSNVKFSVSKHPNGLPGYHNETADSTIEFQAKSSPVKYGLSGGESLQVRFDTSLDDGDGIYDYFESFGEGSDTGHFSIGFHAISATVVDGQSLSGVAVPEPASMTILALGGLAMLTRRRQR